MTDLNGAVQNCKEELGRVGALHAAILNEHQNKIAGFKLRLTDGDFTPLIYNVKISDKLFPVIVESEIVHSVRAHFDSDIFLRVTTTRQKAKTKEVFTRLVQFKNHTQVERVLMLAHDCIDYWAYGKDKISF
jgi:hypothetical protein